MIENQKIGESFHSCIECHSIFRRTFSIVEGEGVFTNGPAFALNICGDCLPKGTKILGRVVRELNELELKNFPQLKYIRETYSELHNFGMGNLDLARWIANEFGFDRFETPNTLFGLAERELRKVCVDCSDSIRPMNPENVARCDSCENDSWSEFPQQKYIRENEFGFENFESWANRWAIEWDLNLKNEWGFEKSARDLMAELEKLSRANCADCGREIGERDSASVARCNECESVERARLANQNA
jgi:hypothetical protein